MVLLHFSSDAVTQKKCGRNQMDVENWTQLVWLVGQGLSLVVLLVPQGPWVLLRESRGGLWQTLTNPC